MAGLTQPYIKAGETAKYESTLRQCGSFMFHAHHDEMTQMGMGNVLTINGKVFPSTASLVCRKGRR